MTKWEYCTIEQYDGGWHCFRLTSKGIETITRSKWGRNESAYWSALAEIIAWLGYEGWEMVGCGSGGGQVTCYDIYFKRPWPE